MSKLTEADLMAYQVEGVNRILSQDKLYLGDDPGLGKTAQIINAARKLPASTLAKGVLLIVPASLRINWHREWEIWDGPDCELHVLSYQAATKDAQKTCPSLLSKWWRDPANQDIINMKLLPHFELGKAEVGVLERTWGLAVFDEAHALKSTKSQRGRALVKSVYKEEDSNMREHWARTPGVRAERLVFLSGTPILNRPSDIFPLLRHLDDKEWSSKTRFEQRYCDAKVDKWGRWDASGLSNAKELREKLKPYLLRRRKKDVLTQLPAKRRQVIELELGKRDTKLTTKLMSELLGLGDSDILTDNDLDMIWTVKGMDQLDGKLQDHVASIRRDVGKAKVKPFIETLIEQDGLDILPDKLVVFAHHREVIEQITDGLNTKGIKAAAYYGGMNDSDKDAVVQGFQKGDLQVFVGSIMAAGVGLTLTAADTCMILEPSYIPAENTQAEDRLHRIGAQKPVLIQYIAAANTLDARVLSLVVSKMEMISEVLS